METTNIPIPQVFYSLNPAIVRVRMKRAEFQAALLACPFTSKGELWDLVGKHIGAGVYDVEAKKWQSKQRETNRSMSREEEEKMLGFKWGGGSKNE